jgi:mannosyltransferase
MKPGIVPVRVSTVLFALMSRSRFRTLVWLAIAAIAVTATWLRLSGLDRESLWLDEAFAVDLARGSVSRLLAEVAEDVHPPFYFLGLSAWFQITDGSAWAARLLSVITSLGVVLSGGLLGRRIGGSIVGLMTSLLLTVSSFQVEFAQEARMYALLAGLATVSTWSLVAMMPRMERPSAGQLPALVTPGWAIYALTTTLLVYTHAAGFFVLASHGSVVMWARWHDPVRARWSERWLTATLAVTAAFLPWLGTFVTQFGAVQDQFWVVAPSWRDVLNPAVAFAGTPWTAAILISSAVLGAWSLMARAKPPAERWTGVVIVSWFVAAVLGPFVVSLFGSSVFLPKYTIAGSVPLALLAASGLAALPRLPRVSVLVIVAALSGQAFQAYYTGMPRKDDWRAAVSDIEGQAAAGDLVVVYPFYLRFPVDVYRARSDLDVRVLPKHAAALTAPALTRLLDDVTRDRARVWLVVMQYDRRHGLLADRLHTRFDDARARRYGHLDVFRFENRTR